MSEGVREGGRESVSERERVVIGSPFLCPGYSQDTPPAN